VKVTKRTSQLCGPKALWLKTRISLATKTVSKTYDLNHLPQMVNPMRGTLAIKDKTVKISSQPACLVIETRTHTLRVTIIDARANNTDMAAIACGPVESGLSKLGGAPLGFGISGKFASSSGVMGGNWGGPGMATVDLKEKV